MTDKEIVYHVTVRVVTELTYRVTRDDAANEDEARKFIDTADIETRDDREIFEEVVDTDIVSVEEVNETPTPTGRK